MRGERELVSWPFGPFTVTSLSGPIVIWTPLGTVIGLIPIRDIALLPSSGWRGPCSSGLPDGAEYLTTDTAAPGFVTGEHAFRGAHDGDPKAALHSRQLVLARVDTEARLAHALDLADHVPPVRAVAELDPQQVLRPLLDHLETFDVSLLLEYPSDRHQDLGRRHRGL